MRKKLLLAIVGSLITAMMFGGVASAHVHGITPLGDISVDDDNSGGNAAEGDPIGGLIPRDVGKAPLTGGDGGSGATDDNAP